MAGFELSTEDRYAYYHCPKCAGVRARREIVETWFLDRLQRLKPDPGYLRLFNAIVLDVWCTQQSRTREVEKLVVNRVAQLRDRLDRLEEAFIFERSIDRAPYEKQRDRIQEDLALANLELQDSRIETAAAEGILGFTGYLLENASRMWLEANLESSASGFSPRFSPRDSRLTVEDLEPRQPV